jgi:NAD(P)-dependent dehydrogenase (short-subunit alcohol dehydrogenase family)
VRIEDSVALVTGANRGLGRAFVSELLRCGAARVYAAVRQPAAVAGMWPGRPVVPVELDITDATQVAVAAARCRDVSLLVNNAGVLTPQPLLGADTMEGAYQDMAVNYFGTLAMCRAFAPVLAANGGGALVNVLSVASWFTDPAMGCYSASKAAAWSLTNGVRVELRGQGTLVVGVHAGYIDTDMAAAVEVPKNSPAGVAARTLDTVAAGGEEVLADARTAQIKAALPTDLRDIYPYVQRVWDQRGAKELA